MLNSGREGRMVIPRGLGEGKMLLFNGYRKSSGDL